MFVTVCTNYITLFNFFPCFVYPIPFEDSIDVVNFFVFWSVIKLKHIVRESVSTIGTPFVFFMLSNFRKVLGYRHLVLIIHYFWVV